MFAKCGKQIMNNLLVRHFLQPVAKRSVLIQSLSTTKLSSNQYDDLYVDRKQKFLCESGYFLAVELASRLKSIYMTCSVQD